MTRVALALELDLPDGVDLENLRPWMAERVLWQVVTAPGGDRVWTETRGRLIRWELHPDVDAIFQPDAERESWPAAEG